MAEVVPGRSTGTSRSKAASSHPRHEGLHCGYRRSLTIRSSVPLRMVAVSSCASRQRPPNSSVREQTMLSSIQMSYARFFIVLFFCSATFVLSCSTASADEPSAQALPPGVVQKGTLANSNLIQDTKLVAAAKLGSMGYR